VERKPINIAMALVSFIDADTYEAIFNTEITNYRQAWEMARDAIKRELEIDDPEQFLESMGIPEPEAV
jgi:hypothetical protein